MQKRIAVLWNEMVDLKMYKRGYSLVVKMFWQWLCIPVDLVSRQPSHRHLHQWMPRLEAECKCHGFYRYDL